MWGNVNCWSACWGEHFPFISASLVFPVWYHTLKLILFYSNALPKKKNTRKRSCESTRNFIKHWNNRRNSYCQTWTNPQNYQKFFMVHGALILLKYLRKKQEYFIFITLEAGIEWNFVMEIPKINMSNAEIPATMRFPSMGILSRRKNKPTAARSQAVIERMAYLWEDILR